MLTSFLVHEAIVETYIGATPRGDGYSAPVTVKGFLDDGLVRVQRGDTEELVQQTRFYTTIDNAPLFKPESRVTVNGRAAQVTHTRLREGGAMFALVEHLEVELT